ncbi:hypothetical protein GPJ56_002742 [Histomonas meleagridis]|uniref:uncharacterized protein n=1 Tax=Histomonas meleagridis TaxID=135588 RepID=UPI0035599888|nr:hypothetical protein GPJ56_002742 [Histomonas meleagridis]KAH0800049.1 hypothetical protein GO595_007161 [Histomonas meleagridis]
MLLNSIKRFNAQLEEDHNQIEIDENLVFDGMITGGEIEPIEVQEKEEVEEEFDYFAVLNENLENSNVEADVSLQSLLERMTKICHMHNYSDEDIEKVSCKFIDSFTLSGDQLPFYPSDKTSSYGYFSVLYTIVNWRPFAIIGQQILLIQSTEAAVERAFSRLQKVRSDLRTDKALEEAKLFSSSF